MFETEGRRAVNQPKVLTGNTRVGDMSSTSACILRPLWIATAVAGTKVSFSVELGSVGWATDGTEDCKPSSALTLAFLATSRCAK